MAFQQFGRPQLPPYPREQVEDPTVAQPPVDETEQRPVAPGAEASPDMGDEETERNEPPEIQQLEDILGVEIPEDMWEKVVALLGVSKVPPVEEPVIKKSSAFQSFGQPKQG